MSKWGNPYYFNLSISITCFVIQADIWRGELPEDKKAIMEEIAKSVGDEVTDPVMEMSNKDDEDSVMAVKTRACDLLLQHRVELKFKTKKADGILNRYHQLHSVYLALDIMN